MWIIATGIAFFPALSGAKVSPSPYFFDMLWKVNKAGFFREAFFVAIIIAIVAVTNLIDNVIRKDSSKVSLFRMACWLAFSYYILLMVYGTFAFASIPLHHSVPKDTFLVDTSVILVAVIAGALTEILIAIGE